MRFKYTYLSYWYCKTVFVYIMLGARMTCRNIEMAKVNNLGSLGPGNKWPGQKSVIATVLNHLQSF